MGKRTEQPKKSISLTLSRENIEALEAMSREIEYNPSLSQLVDRAITEFREARAKTDPRSRKPR